MTQNVQYWVNGVPQTTLPIADRSIQFGDGCFTTLRIVSSRPVLAGKHIQRLTGDSARLGLTPPDDTLLMQWMSQAADGVTDGVLKVMITAGEQGRGYLRAETPPVVILIRSAYPENYPSLRENGLSVVKSPISLGINPHLAGIKHLNRLEQVLIRRYVAEQGADEAVAAGSDGFLAEGCSANIFWRCGDNVFTPPLEKYGVNGIMRSHIISVLKESRWHCREEARYPQVLAAADEVIMCNALMPLMPVNDIRFDEKTHRRYTSRSLFTWLAPHCMLHYPD